MKTKHLLVAALTLATSFSIAQTAEDTVHKLKKHPTDKMVTLYLQNGKMQMMNNEGKSIILDKDMVLADGTVITTDGNVKLKNGVSTQMKDGDSVDMNGKIHPKRMRKRSTK